MPAPSAATDPVADVDAVVGAAVGPLRVRALLRATPLLAWALTATFGLLGLVYAIVVPLLHGPDEGAHVDRIAVLGLGEQFTLDPTAPMTYSRDLLAAFEEVGIEPVDQRVLPRLPWTPLNTVDVERETGRPLSARPPYPDLAPDGSVEERFRNTAKSHPPGHYAFVDAADAVVTTLGVPDVDEASWGATLARWRAWSALLLLPIPWVAFWIAARVVATGATSWPAGVPSPAAPRRAGHVAAALTLTAPQLSHSAGTVNNDALLLTGTSLCLLAVAWLATGDRSRAVVAWAGVGAGIAAFSKVFGIGAPVWIVAAAWVAHRDRPALATRLVAVAAGWTVVAGGWWVLAMTLQHGTPAPRGFNYPQPPDLEVSVTTWLREVVERLTSTGFGRLGVEQFGIPGWSVWLATLLLVGLVVAGLVPLRRRPGLAVVLLLPFATTLAMVTYAAWGGYARSGIPSGLHGRYLFVAVPTLAALAGIGLRRLVPGTAMPLVAALGVATLLQGLGLVTSLASWWPGGWVDRVRTATLFSGWTDPLLALLALAGAVVAGALAVGLRRELAPVHGGAS